MNTETSRSTAAAERLAQRLDALGRYEIMDTPAEKAFDDLTQLASYICQVPISTLTFVDGERQWFKSKIGITADGTPISESICATAIESTGLFTVHDTLEDQTFANLVCVKGDPRIRFYAGAPLVTQDGVALGMLCAVDQVPRILTVDQQNALQALARQAMALLELRIALREKEVALASVKQLQDMLPMCSYCQKVRDDDNYWQNVDAYIASHSELRFSHGICPDCMDGMLAELGGASVSTV